MGEVLERFVRGGCGAIAHNSGQRPHVARRAGESWVVIESFRCWARYRPCNSERGRRKFATTSTEATMIREKLFRQGCSGVFVRPPSAVESSVDLGNNRLTVLIGSEEPLAG